MIGGPVGDMLMVAVVAVEQVCPQAQVVIQVEKVLKVVKLDQNL